ncbi:MAG: NUDIX hydrolase [Anaerolineales bacterium]|nr:NUDIX hydrolase [Anaerolineales bacterium]
MTQPSPWLRWAQRLQALAQSGLAYTESPYDAERYAEIRQIAAEMLASGDSGDAARLAALFAAETGYATPKIDVRGVVFRDEQVLLVLERADNAWTLPGGWADVGQSPTACVEREVREESGFETRATRLLAVYDRNLHGHPPMLFHTYKLFFLCELRGGAAAPSTETSAVGFFPVDALPPLSVSRVTAAQIRRMHAHYHHPEWPTDFD